MTRRDLLSEVVGKRARAIAGTTRIGEFSKRLNRLDDAMRSLLATADPDSTACDAELTRHFPVALVACIEGFFRKAVADLIDHGSPFIERVGKLRDTNITLGEYVSHFLSFGSLEGINRSLSSLLAFDFLERLVTSAFHLYESEPPVQLDEARKDFVEAVKELFQMRHMLCHEFASELVIDNAMLIRAFAATDALVSLSEVVIAAELQDWDG